MDRSVYKIKMNGDEIGPLHCAVTPNYYDKQKPKRKLPQRESAFTPKVVGNTWRIHERRKLSGTLNTHLWTNDSHLD